MFITYNSNEKKLCFNDPWYLKSWCLTATISTTAGYRVWSKKVISFPKGSLETNFEVPKHKKAHRRTAVIAFWAYTTHVHFITSNLIILQKWYNENPKFFRGVGFFLYSELGGIHKILRNLHLNLEIRNFLSLMVSLDLPIRRDPEIGYWLGQRACCNFSPKALRKEVFRVLVTPLSPRGSTLYHKLSFWTNKTWTDTLHLKKSQNPHCVCCRKKMSITSTPEAYCKTFLVCLTSEMGQHFTYWFKISLSQGTLPTLVTCHSAQI